MQQSNSRGQQSYNREEGGRGQGTGEGGDRGVKGRQGGRLPGPRASSTAGAPGGPCVL